MNWDNVPLPHWIGPYRIVGRLGQGGMGQVYIGRSPGGMKVAVKVIRPQRVDDAEFRRRFAREVQAARQVNSAYTAAVVDADPEADEPWLATVHVAGVSLDQALRQHGPWPASSVRALGAGLVEALSAIHGAGVVHRDLKPSNVILTSNGPRVIDFGISAVAGATKMTTPGAFVGTPGFASPEQIQDQPIGPASDIFSLGVLLAHTATGHNPFGRHTTDPSVVFYRTLHELPTLDGMPADLHAVITPCLAKDPAARPTTAALLRQLVEPTDDIVTVLGTDAWLPPSVAELAALSGAELTGATPQATAPATPTPTAAPTVRDDTPGVGQAGASTNGVGTNPAFHQADTAPDSSSPSPSPRPDSEVSTDDHRAADRRGHRANRTRRRRILPGLTAVVVALALLATAGWWWNQREDHHGTTAADGVSTTPASTPSSSPTRSPSATASPTPKSSPTPKRSPESEPSKHPAADSDDGPEPPSEISDPDWRCRSGWMVDQVRKFSFNPCVAPWQPGVAYTVKVNSPTAQTVTIYYWLGRAVEDQNDDVLMSTRQSCTMELKAGETKECPIRSSQPQTPGEVHASATGSPTSKDGAGSTMWYFDGTNLTDRAG
ncbi:serine/threonine-protein kinase [Streptomyces sp. NPDC058690]|uniref:serine/threonine-protein kinase n=1 Tax=Streptomyces sp. NPDC058690 TaxID=3346600 RepID=UPI003663849C